MNLFSTYSFYLAVLGFVLTAVFLKITNQPPKPISFVQAPSTSPFDSSIAASGIIEALNENIAVGSTEEGLVKTVFHAVGDHVEKNDPIIKLDTDLLMAELAIKKAKKNVNAATLKKQKAKLSRLEAVDDLKAISREEIEVLKDDVLIAEAELEVARAEVLHVEELIKKRTVRAPKEGIILKQSARVGEYIAKDATAIILGDPEKLQIRVSIDEQNAINFEETSPAVAYPKNNTSAKFNLKFLRIEPFVIPKTSLTGVGKEIVDTRVLQVIYALEPKQNFSIYVGQQMDVYIKKPEKESRKEDAKGEKEG